MLPCSRATRDGRRFGAAGGGSRMQSAASGSATPHCTAATAPIAARQLKRAAIAAAAGVQSTPARPKAAKLTAMAVEGASPNHALQKAMNPTVPAKQWHAPCANCSATSCQSWTLATWMLAKSACSVVPSTKERRRPKRSMNIEPGSVSVRLPTA